MIPTRVHRYQVQQATKNAIEELYLRILFEDQTISLSRKLRILSNLFSNKVPSKLTVTHMEVLDKVRGIIKMMRMNNMDITYHALHSAWVFHNNHHEHQKN